ncbi:hypothetical protein SAMN05443667_101239 [Flavobacterium gillisiae]|uniref:Late embryogenesis abundant protein n=1 Tax=Flavobacterium gillisiae TaxID=150146 RepID=A0A1H3WWG9_9FLAO|nr:hypothetical protein [Flavobacterium gillisiae]SDZ90538.1 hypothetical protein SAMN05443667_101239 [Flavobacterium gillisiae]
MEGATILKVLGGAAVVTTLFAFKKKSDFSKVMEQMTMDIRNIRNLRLKSGRLFLDIDVAFHNPTQYDMTVYTAGMIKVKQIKLFYKNVLIGNALSTAGKDAFELPAKSNYLITGITVELLFLTIIDQFLKGGLDSNVDNYQIHTVVDALGKSWIVEQ